MSGHPGAVLCGRDHGAVDVVVQGHGQLLVGYQLEVKGHHFLAARQTPTSYAPVLVYKLISLDQSFVHS